MNRNHYFDDRNLNREQRRALEKVKRQCYNKVMDIKDEIEEKLN